jgi:hypothetical protein
VLADSVLLRKPALRLYLTVTANVEKQTMKQIISIFILSLIFSNSYSQRFDSKFDTLIASFGTRVGPFYEDSLRIPEIYTGKDFSIRLAENALDLSLESKILLNPSSDDSFPLSYSVIYDDHLISLFKPGNFICYRLEDFSRNNELEKSLNKKKFKGHSIIDGNLHAQTKLGFWNEYSGNKWKKASGIPNPRKFKSHLYYDREFIVFSDCNGEWGGTLYFYHRPTKKTYYTSATCANTVTREKDGFEVLSHLGHLVGSADLKLIEDPIKLPNLKDFKGDKRSINAIGNSDTTDVSKEIFDFYWIQIFSKFQLSGKEYFMIHWQEMTFLAEIDGTEISIVHPLFNSDLYTHDPITKVYKSGEVLINLDHYGTGLEKEVSMVLIKDNKFTKIEWQEKH